MGKIIRCFIVLAIWIVLSVGICAALPDEVWQTFPQKLIPIRTFLAENKIISSEYANPEYRKTDHEKKPLNSSINSRLKLNGDISVRSNVEEDFTKAEPRSPETPGGLSKNLMASSNSGNSSEFNPITTENNRKDLPPIPELQLPKIQSFPNLDAQGRNDTLPNLKFDSATSDGAAQKIAGQTQQMPFSAPAARTEGNGLPAPSVAGLTLTSSDSGQKSVAVPNAVPNASLSSGPVNPINTSSENPNAPRPIGVTVPAQNGIAPASGLMPVESIQPNAASVRNPLYIEQERKAEIQNNIVSANTKSLSDELGEVLTESARINGGSSDFEIRNIFMKLSTFLTDKESQLPQEEVQRLQKELDRLAYQVFYNPKRHILEPAYTAMPGETISSIAEKYRITPEFLAILNQINLNPTQPLPTATQLKVIHGPVSAAASINKKELLLLFNGLYAGRFRMGCSMNAKSVRGMLIVTNKVKNPDYKGPTEENSAIQDIPGGAVNNPLGSCWIELSNGLGLQGTNRPEYVGNETARNGGLIFSNKDISHLNILLPKGAIIQLQN